MLFFDQLNKADRHLRAISCVVAAGMLTLLGGLWWVQGLRSSHYAEGQRNQSFRTIRVPAPRGRILDRNGVALADNEAVYNISLYLDDPSWRARVQQQFTAAKNSARKNGATMRPPTMAERVLSVFGYKPSLLKLRRLSRSEETELGREARYAVTSNIVAQISELLGKPLAINATNFHKHYQQRLALPLPIATDLDITNVSKFQERALHLPGVDMEINPKRVYPRGTLASHVLGYLTRSEESAEDELSFYNYRLPDHRGLFGIEASFDEDLRGKAGAKSVLVNNLGYRQNETILSPIEPGKNVTLTIDAEIQQIAEQELFMAGKLGRAATPVRGAAVVVDVKTGEIIALASAPAFNPNDWVPYLPSVIWNTYTNEDVAPLQNRAVYGHFAPGSIFKIIVSIAGIEARTLDTNEIIRVDDVFYLQGHKFNDTAPPGDYNFHRAFIKSSNGYFIQMGLRAKPERMVDVAQRLGFGERTGIPLGESRGLLPTTEWVRVNRRGWSAVGVGNFSIGQGDLDVTPLQIALGIGAVANGGKVLKPQLVLNVRGSDELVPASNQNQVQSVVRQNAQINPLVLKPIREAMLADVEDPEGTAYKAFHTRENRLNTFRVGGKTGTAQVFKGLKFDHYTVWFASYGGISFEDPRYAVVVMVDHGSSGGGTCAPIAAKIYQGLERREQRLQYSTRQTVVRN